ncbi:DUF732 domain-containing protein [Corynebacterium alimapuense]|uniref:Uncharacterized protein n=1 Tax=Corynebacterium alimapuense TaxID=1576874 RepID=A0A3M8K9V3_9CORY|nr:DUF732 domain-containing protein [Corynebacterium alimapuense]RNE49991.1 hypothetical protein C5L39_01045 [Corynebacterium alimapuense]
MRTWAKTGLIAATCVSALALTACGEATVEDDSTTAPTVAPLERGPSSSEATTAAESSEAQSPIAQDPATPQPQDQGAREVDEVPELDASRSAEDQVFLGELSDNGVDIVGVEDQMIGTAITICSPEGTGIDLATVPAVAGQLIEQGRTDLSAEEVATLIEDAARKAYC